MSQVIGDAIAVAIVAFAISVSMAQLFAKKHNYEVDSNQELLAEGATNMVCANLNCYMMCVSLSRSVVCENLGCKSQLNALFSGGLMLLVILFIASYFRALPSVSPHSHPHTCFSSICFYFRSFCFSASWRLLSSSHSKACSCSSKTCPSTGRSTRPTSCVIPVTIFHLNIDIHFQSNVTSLQAVWLVTFVAVVLLDVALGLVVGILFSILTVVGSTQRLVTSR